MRKISAKDVQAAFSSKRLSVDEATTLAYEFNSQHLREFANEMIGSSNQRLRTLAQCAVKMQTWPGY